MVQGKYPISVQCFYFSNIHLSICGVFALAVGVRPLLRKATVEVDMFAGSRQLRKGRRVHT